MHTAPADRRRTITLSDLPPGAIFTCPGTRWRGLVLSWHRDRRGNRRECSALLLHARGDDTPAVRKVLRAGIKVEILAEHDAINLSTRSATAADVFAHQLHVRNGAQFPAYMLAIVDDHEPPELVLPGADITDVQLPEAA